METGHVIEEYAQFVTHGIQLKVQKREHWGSRCVTFDTHQGSSRAALDPGSEQQPAALGPGDSLGSDRRGRWYQPGFGSELKPRCENEWTEVGFPMAGDPGLIRMTSPTCYDTPRWKHVIFHGAIQGSLPCFSVKCNRPTSLWLSGLHI